MYNTSITLNRFQKIFYIVLHLMEKSKSYPPLQNPSSKLS